MWKLNKKERKTLIRVRVEINTRQRKKPISSKVVSLKTSPKLLSLYLKWPRKRNKTKCHNQKLFRSILIFKKLKGLWGNTLCQQIRPT